MLDNRKSGLLQQAPPSLSRNELYISLGATEVKPGVRQRRHSFVDNSSLPGGGVHVENNELTVTDPRITGQPSLPPPVPVGTVDHITNGDFGADTDWAKGGAEWTIAAGVATCSGAQVAGTTLTQIGATLTTPLIEGLTYQVTYTISGFTAGVVQVVLGGGTGGALAGADGTFVQNIVAGAGDDFVFSADTNFDANIDDVSMVTASGSYNVGGTLRLSVGAVGGGGVTYQWQVDAGDIVGATDAILVIADLDVTDSGTYTCDVTNSSGTVTSADVVVTVV